MGDFFKKLDEIMTGDLVRRIGGGICVIAVILVGAGFFYGTKSVLQTMKGPAVAVEAVDGEAAEQDEDAISEDAEEEDGGEEDDYEDEEDYDE